MAHDEFTPAGDDPKEAMLRILQRALKQSVESPGPHVLDNESLLARWARGLLSDEELSEETGIPMKKLVSVGYFVPVVTSFPKACMMNDAWNIEGWVGGGVEPALVGSAPRRTSRPSSNPSPSVSGSNGSVPCAFTSWPSLSPSPSVSGSSGFVPKTFIS